MQRIKPANPEGDPQLAAAYERITRTRGYVSNILMSLSNAPEGLERFAAFGEYVRYGSELPARVRELSVLAIARGNQYAWTHHHPHAIKAGISQQELDALESHRLPTLSPPAKSGDTIRAGIWRGGNVADATFDELRRHYSDRQITDLTLLAGYFLALGTTIAALKVQLEPDFPPKARAST